MKIKLFVVFIFCFTKLNVLFGQVNPTSRQVVLQSFWWDYWNSNYVNGWANYLTELAPRLKELGIDAVWIPPTIKNNGTNSVGYSPFDHYDLGDKYQKNATKTRMGDKDELLRMVAVMHANGIDVIQDIVLNHVSNAGSSNGAGGQDPSAMDDGQTNRYKNFRYTCFKTPASAETALNYLSREGKFPKNWQNFYPNNSNVCCTNDINSPFWGPDASYESNANGLSSNASFNPSQTSDYMRVNMRNWLIWYKKQVGWDGLRFDAVKHFPSYVAEDFLWNLQYNALYASGGADMFAVGEWVGSTTQLDAWCDAVQNRAGTFDFNLRFTLASMVSANGAFDLSTIPGQQQLNRGRTVPFVNNHDTFRPTLNSQGNYTGWNTSSELSPHIEPNDGRNSVAHAIVMSLDGAPQLFFEDLFSIGYNGNRFTHQPTSSSNLPLDSDVENLIWCHQNLHFKQGNYLIRWQAPDALVIERESKALIGVNDQWTNWQNLVGVQTSWSDGTILMDYSGSNGNTTSIVYGGGKVNISIPPCDGSANLGRRGYCVWAPQGMDTNYVRPGKSTTQEWEMSDDLGDSHMSSLQQGGALPNNSLECRTVGRIFAKSGTTINVELYPSVSTLPIRLILLDKDCQEVDSMEQAGTINFSHQATYDGWYTIRIRNASSTQAGQKCWVKAIYLAPQVVQTSVVKNKCACSMTDPNAGLPELDLNEVALAPNPFEEYIEVQFPSIDHGFKHIEILNLEGKILKSISNNSLQQSMIISLSDLPKGSYVIRFISDIEIKSYVIVK
jgi:alpha-amylase